MKYIYESPDGGKTVFQREIGSDDRVLIDDQTAEQRDDLERWLVWRNILTAAKTDPEIKEALDRIKMLYELKRRAV
jgi:hypothetical protein